MGWRGRFGGDDERAQIAARARALLATVPPSPPPAPRVAVPPATPAASASADLTVSRTSSPDPVVGPTPDPPRRGGWVPTTSALTGLDVAPAAGGRHAREVEGLWPEPIAPGLIDGFTDGEPSGGAGWRGGSARAATDRAGWRDRIRFDPGRRGLVAVAAVVVVVGSVAGGLLVRGGTSSAVTVAAASGTAPTAASAAPVAGTSTTGGSTPSARASTSTSTGASVATGTVTVDVAGLVAHPGVYTLPAGSRVEDALRVAGGAQPSADLSTLNRARVLVDGEQLAVGVPGATGAAPAGAATAGSTAGPAGLVDLNTATPEQLDTLPGVGPVLAQAIVAWRTDHGRFASVDDLQQVSGIGPSKFADVKALVTV